jgi:deglycase
VVVVGIEAGALVHGKRGRASATTHVAAVEADPARFDLLLIPGGHSPDNLRMEEQVVDFVKRFLATGEPVAAICHGPQLLIEADAVRGMTLTSWPSIRKDLENAGAKWIDEPVVEDRWLITSRRPHDVDAFSAAVLGRLARHAA